MKMLKVLLVAVVFSVAAFNVTPAAAQCAACSAMVESNAENGASTTKGLNNGVLYLLAMPYLAAALGGFIWYKKFRRKPVEINMRQEKLHLN